MAAVVQAYPIIAVDIDDSKLEFAREFGATHTVNSSKVDPIATIIEMTNGGVDYAFDAIGLRITNEQIRCECGDRNNGSNLRSIQQVFCCRFYLLFVSYN